MVTRSPADMHPPWYTPSSPTASTVVAVPKSSTITGRPYFSMAATQATDRSGPSRSSVTMGP